MNDAAQQRLEELVRKYQAVTPTVNIVVYGDIGTGKTTLCTTAPAPILIHSFDPGGTKVVPPEMIKEGRVIPDTRFEDEDPAHPKAFRLWEQVFEQLRKDKAFDAIGTYVIDSATTWAEAAMNEILRQKGRAGGVPQLQDYQIQMNTIRDYMRIMTALPCHTILTGHIDATQDEVTGRVLTGLLITGKLKTRIPLLFDEMWVTVSKETSKGTEYSVLTRNNGFYKARTRIGSGKFDLYEKPDIKYLLKKAGLPADDKPLLSAMRQTA